eukprot:14083691-Alexandrium_andersonii.AAC.1
MSASLVGSEMCIRDSLVGLSESDRFAKAKLPFGHTSTPENGYLRAAVSYTHLTLPTICSV